MSDLRGDTYSTEMCPANALDAACSAWHMYSVSQHPAVVCVHPEGGYFATYKRQSAAFRVVATADSNCESYMDVYKQF